MREMRIMEKEGGEVDPSIWIVDVWMWRRFYFVNEQNVTKVELSNERDVLWAMAHTTRHTHTHCTPFIVTVRVTQYISLFSGERLYPELRKCAILSRVRVNVRKYNA